MDSRLIFLHHLVDVLTDGETQKGRHTGDRNSLAAILGGSPRKIREIINSEESGEVRLRPNQLADPMPPRKTSREFISCPYRKPTQVGRERIPRRMSDLSLRNSAY